MLILDDALHHPELPRGVVATIGNYDGVHRGQRAILERVVERARERALRAVAITFDPHPKSVLRPETAPALLTPRPQRDALIAEIGLDALLVIRFDTTFAATSADDFARDFLHRRLDMRELHVGSDFRFGRGRTGDLAHLQALGETLGFTAEGGSLLREDGAVVSSTRIRSLLDDGHAAAARALLGRPYALYGTVVRGARMGQRLGWPTINLDPVSELIPASGVYVSRVRLPSYSSPFEAVTNIGTRPTVYESFDRVIESHLIDFDGDVYGQAVEVELLDHLRDEQMFSTVMELAAQIGRDVEAARTYFAARRTALPTS
ncbi:MAG: bifunctional riboflavin kinase/FAD synthetase [Acidobacteriota bacterium]